MAAVLDDLDSFLAEPASAPQTQAAPAAQGQDDLDSFLNEAPPPSPGVVLPSIKRTAGQFVESAGTALEDITGKNAVTRGLQDFGGGVVKANPSQIQSLSDIASKPWTAVKETVAEQVPQLGATLAGARTGAALGGALGSVVPGIGTGVGAAGGALIGGLAPIFLQEYGEIRGKQKETGEENVPLALAGAGVASALERVGLEKVASKIGAKGVKEALGVIPAGSSRVKHIGKEALKTAAIEGPLTEVPQTVIERGAGGQEIGTPEALSEYALAGGKGALGGGVIGGALGALAPREQAAPVVPPVVPPAVPPGPVAPEWGTTTGVFPQGQPLAPGAPPPLAPDYETALGAAGGLSPSNGQSIPAAPGAPPPPGPIGRALAAAPWQTALGAGVTATPAEDVSGAYRDQEIVALLKAQEAKRGLSAAYPKQQIARRTEEAMARARGEGPQQPETLMATRLREAQEKENERKATREAAGQAPRQTAEEAAATLQGTAAAGRPPTDADVAQALSAESAREETVSGRGVLGRAAQERQQPQGGEPERQRAGEVGAPAETGRGDRVERGGAIAAEGQAQVAAIDAAAHEAATSPRNDLPEPTVPQQKAGNYKHGHVRLHGLDLSIEHPQGSVRRGVDKEGRPWAVTMAASYGYIKGTVGKDKNHIDAYIGEHPDSDRAFIVDQVDPKTGRFDEHKTVFGARSVNEANQIYDAAFSDGSGPSRRKAVSEVSVEEFKAWLASGNTKAEFAPTHQGKGPAEIAPPAASAEAEFTAKERRTQVTRPGGSAAAEENRGGGESALAPPKEVESTNLQAEEYPEGKPTVKYNGETGAKAPPAEEADLTEGERARVATGRREAEETAARLTKAELTEEQQARIAKGRENLAEYAKTHATPEELRKALGPSWAVARDTPANRERYRRLLTPKQFRDLNAEIVANRGQPKPAEAKPTPKKPKRPVAKAPPPKDELKDVGEKIEGARKDLWAGRALGQQDIVGMNERELQKFVTKEHVFPRPDYQAIADHVNAEFGDRFDAAKQRFSEDVRVLDMGAGTALLIKKIRDSIANPPLGASRESLEDYLTAIAMVRKALEDLQNFIVPTGSNLVKLAFGEEIVKNERYQIWNQESPNWKYLNALGNKFARIAQVDARDWAKAIMEAEKTGFPATQEVWQREYRVFSKDDLKIKRGTRFIEGKPIDAFFLAAHEGRFIGDFKTEAEAEAAKDAYTPYLVLAKKSGHVVKQVDTEAEGINFARDTYKAQHPTVKREDKTPELRHIVREGQDYRGGRDIGDNEFRDAFGFRGVQFGNWTDQRDRQQSLNHAYDALMDLADALGIPPKALSLNGELGMAFGARGTGRAAAHYEPTRVVINLTKTSGAGTAAHEWAHALDDYFGRISGDLKGKKSPFASHGVSTKTAMRPEMVQAFKDVMNVIHNRLQTEKEVLKAAQADIEKSNRYVGSWLKGLREELKDAEQHGSGFDALAAAVQNAAGDAREERDALISYIGEKNGKLPSKDRRNGLDNNLDWRRRYYERLNKALTGEAQPMKLTSEYSRLSTAKGPYWARAHELFARAFESFMLDKLAGQGRRSDYLVHPGKQDRETTDPDYPYPAGSERTNINAAFEKFVGAIAHKETEKGVALYSYAGERGAKTPKHALAAAREYAKQGTPMEEIRKTTGWHFVKADGKWRFEISDKAARLKLDWDAYDQTVGDALDHKTLFENYPSLAKIGLVFRFDLPGNVTGGYSSADNAIHLNANLTPAGARSTLLHELQHAVQVIEGFARGGKPTDKGFISAAAAMGIDTNNKDAMVSAYRRLMGEVEARDVQARADLTAEELRERPPYVSQGIPEEDFIVRHEGEIAADITLGQTAAGLRANLVKRLGTRAIEGLERAGFEIVETEDKLPDEVRPPSGEAVRGVYWKGKSYLVARNIPEGTELGVLLHEVGTHHGLEGLLGTKLHRALLGNIKAILSPLERAIAAGKSQAELNAIRSRIAAQSPLAKALVEARGRVPNDTRAGHVVEEVLAYTVEDNANRNLTLVKRVLGAIRAWLLRHGFQLKEIRPEDLVALARASVFAVSREATVQRGEAAPAYAAEAPTFYSEMAKFIDAKAPGKTTAAQWKVLLDAWSKPPTEKGDKPPKFKRDELEWSAVKEWLDLQTGPVTKDQVLGFVREEGVRVEETTLGKQAKPVWNDWSRALRDRGLNANDAERIAKAVVAGDEEAIDEANQSGVSESDVQERLASPEDVKFAQWQLPGGENYRELLLRLPERNAPLVYPEPLASLPEGYDLIQDTHQREDRQWGITPPGQTHAGPWAGRHATKEAAIEAALSQVNEQRNERAATAWRQANEGSRFRSSHFDEPNILAHVRFNERTDVGGKRVLFLEEIQSDYAQKGKKEGFQGKVDTTGWRAEKDREGAWHVIINGRRSEIGLMVESEQAAIAKAAEMNAKAGLPRAPFVGKTEAWVGLALKRMIRYAAENGFDRVAWTTGEQQAERYDLSKQVKHIAWEKNDDGTYNINAPLPNGEPGLYKEDLQAKELPDLIGKEIAEKIVNGEGTLREPGAYREWRILQGDDLKVGGHGMRAFYDKIVPNAANALLKKIGGGRVGTVELEFAGGDSGTGWRVFRPDGTMVANQSTRQNAERYMKEGYRLESPVNVQPSFDITPALRESAMRGLPLFSRQDDQRRLQSVRKAMAEIAAGKAEGVARGLRPDLSQYGGDADVHFPWGDRKHGVYHIGSQRGLDVLSSVLRAVALGAQVQYVPAKKTVRITHEGIVAVLSLDEHGKRKTWLLTGWEEGKPDARGEVSTRTVATQPGPTFSRTELGAGFLDTIAAPGGPVKGQQAPLYSRRRDPNAPILDSEIKVRKNGPGVRSRYKYHATLKGEGVYGFGDTPAEARAKFRELKESFEREMAERRAAPKYSRATAATATLPGLLDNGNVPPPNPFSEENRRLREEDKTVWDRAKKFWSRNFTPGGLLPAAVFEQKNVRDGELGVVELDTENLVAQLDSAVKKVYGKRMEELSPAERGSLQQALTGKVVEDLDPRARTVIEAMRQHVDRLSGEYVAILEAQIADMTQSGDPTAEARASLLQTITGNLGRYVHRSYRAFDDPQWFSKLPNEVIDAARAYLRGRYVEGGMEAGEADAKAERALHTIVKTGTAYDSMEAFIRESKLGAKDLSILQHRKDIAPEIRALLGEYDDPRLNYAKSTSKMARLIWNTRFLDRVREIGLGTFLFEEADAPPGATTKIAVDASEVHSPLNGLWTFPEIDQAFKDGIGKEKMADWYRVIVQMNGAVKYGKVILSPTTQIRNFMSAAFFALANGHFDMRHIAKSVDTLRGKSPDYARELVRLGIMDNGAYAGEMMQLIRDSKIEEILRDKKSTPYRVWRDLNKFVRKAYRNGDDFWKIIGFENEKAALMKVGVPEAQAGRDAAERIRNTYPTYSMVGRGIKWLARFPLAGTFVSFPAEIIRTTGHMLRYLAKDYQDPQRRPLAIRRAAGLAMVSGFAYALQAMTMAMMGMDDDEEEAVRRLAAPWQRNSNFLFTGRDERGQLRYFDLSFLDPYNWFKRPITALLRDQPWEDKATGALSDMLSPFLGTDIAAGALFEVLSNKKESGGPVYNEFADPVDQSVAIADHLRKALQPGFVGNLERTYRAAHGDYTPSGKRYDLADEGMSWIGWRVTTLDPKTSLYYRSFEFTDAKKAATSTLNKALATPNEVSREAIASAKASAQRQLSAGFRDMHLIINAAMKNGMTRPEVIRVLRTSGVSLRDIPVLLSGREPKLMVSPQQVKNATTKARAIYGGEKALEIRRRYQEAAVL